MRQRVEDRAQADHSGVRVIDPAAALKHRSVRAGVRQSSTGVARHRLRATGWTLAPSPDAFKADGLTNSDRGTDSTGTHGIVGGVADVVLAPYLPLRKDADVGPWHLVPFSGIERVEYLSQEIAEDARLLVSAYRMEGARLGALLVPSGSRVGSECDRASLGPLHRALLLGMLEVNPSGPAKPDDEPEDPNAGHKATAAENALVYGHPVRGDGRFATQTGFMATYLVIHGRIRANEKIRIAPPGELPTPIMATDLDSEYASAALSVMSAGDETGRRVSRAAEWLGVAWQNTSSITQDARILALRSGFEVLLSTSDTGDSTRQLRSGLSQLLDEPQAPRQQRMWSERGQSRSAPLTDLEWWFQSFTLLRNAIAHGHIVTRERLTFDDGGGLHVFIGESTLRRSIKRTIARAGHPDVEDDALGRAIREVFRGLHRNDPEDSSI